MRAEADGPPPDQHAVSMAALGVLRSLAVVSPLVLAIDDIHWIDPSSARVLGFAVRRLKDERVGILASARAGIPIPVELSQALDRMGMRHVIVGPMAPEGTRVVASGTSRCGPATSARGASPRDLRWEPVLRLGDRPCSGAAGCSSGPRRATPRAGGPPATARISARRASDRRRGAPPHRRRRGSADRAPRPRDRRTARTMPWPASGRRSRRASSDGRAGSIRFTHPLLGSTVYATASAQTRRRLHGRLAEMVPDHEERARHLALGGHRSRTPTWRRRSKRRPVTRADEELPTPPPD